jgi:hypothetical protein
MKSGDNKAISNYEKMIFDNSSIIADVEPEYQETTIKIAGGVTKRYSYRYNFKVNEAAFSGGFSTSELLNKPQVNVFYLKTDPNVSCTEPQRMLDQEKSKNTSKSDLWWGIALAVIGCITLKKFISDIWGKDEDIIDDVSTVNA